MEKLARICWNTEGWRQPSGSEGKSRIASSYENKNGFGHEEWLFDDSKIIDGYHYGFLQPMNAKTHIGKRYDIHLFTITPLREKVYIGCLRNAEGVTLEERKKVFQTYQNNGWLQEMEEAVKGVGGKVEDFNPEFLFNVKFKFADAEIHSSNQPIVKSDSIGHRYNLMDLHGDLEFEKDSEGENKSLNTEMYWRVSSAGKVLVNPVHKKMQQAVQQLLEQDYENLYLEMNYVDMKGQPKGDKDIWHFFEFKTYSAKRCIREALGQILEYAHYPSKVKAQKLFIIGRSKPDDQDIAYLKFLREKYNLPLWYRWYSFEQNMLHEEV